MTNVNASVEKLYVLGGPSGKGRLYAGWLKGATKAAQNDTITISNASAVDGVVGLVTDTAGAAEGFTVATNVITCTSATTGTVSGIVVYKEM